MLGRDCVIIPAKDMKRLIHALMLQLPMDKEFYTVLQKRGTLETWNEIIRDVKRWEESE